MGDVKVEYYSEECFRREMSKARESGDAELIKQLRRKRVLSRLVHGTHASRRQEKVHVTEAEQRVLREKYPEKFAEEVIEYLIAIRRYSDYGSGITDPERALVVARKYAANPNFVKEWDGRKDGREDYSWAIPMVAALITVVIVFLVVAAIQ